MRCANICAVSALNALGHIDPCQIVFHDDRIRRALTLASQAADTPGFAGLHNQWAPFGVGAGGHDLLLFRDQLHDALRAGIHTGAAADAVDPVYLGDAIDNMHCVELADLRTVAETDAGKGAELVASAAEKHRSAAILRPVVMKAELGSRQRAAAGDKRNHLVCSVTADAHDLGNFGRRGFASRDTAVYQSMV